MAAPVGILTKKGSKWKLDPESLKAFFDVKSIEDRPGAKRLMEEIRDRIKSGIDRNQRDYKLFKAMDWAYDAPFYQVSYTQLRHIINNQPDDKKVLDMTQSWGLTHLLPDVLDSNGNCCKNSDGTTQKAVNLPVFFHVFVPVCMAYITVRWAKLFNDRNIHPHFKYEPAQYTIDDRLRCELITQIVQKMASWFDYPADTKQTILQMLMYGVCLNFPKEAWYVERQIVDEAGTKKIIREGIRFEQPHPSRMYADPYFRLSTLNSNSGCEYCGHWELARYRDIRDNKMFWNTDKVSMGSVGWFQQYGDFFEQVAPCAMKWPTPKSSGIGLDRQSEIECYYDTKGDADMSTLKTNHFQRLIPKDYGMGDYDEPIWFRFIVASDMPVLWAEPLAYDVTPTYAYDPDFNRGRFRSLTLEIMPFQDQISQQLSQWILAVRQNLMNPVFYDIDKIPKEYMDQLRNMGLKNFSGVNYIPYSSGENRKFQVDQREAFASPQMTRHNTAEISNMLAGILNVLDRIMQMSPQEVGQAATHEQTAEESRIIANNTGTRVTFTGSGIDAGNHAKKKMLYDGIMAYADDEIVVGIDSSFLESDEDMKVAAKRLGIEFVDKDEMMTEGTKSPKNPKTARLVKVKKQSLQLEQFASTREGEARINNAAIAEAMSKIYLALAGQPTLLQAVGTQQMIEFLNQISIVAGLPKEFKLRGKDIDISQPPEEQAKQFQQLLTGFAEQVKKLVDEKQQETIQASAEQTQQIVQQAIQALGGKLQPVFQAVADAGKVNAAQQQQIDHLSQAVEQLTTTVPPAMAQPQPGGSIPPELAAAAAQQAGLPMTPEQPPVPIGAMM